MRRPAGCKLHAPVPDMPHAHLLAPALAPWLLSLVSLFFQPLPAQAADGRAAATADALTSPDESQLLALVNDYRAGLGLAPLQDDPSLVAIARANSQRMAEQRQLGHEGFDQRHRQAGGRVCVENLAAGFRRVGPLLAGWQASPGHDRNLRDARISHAGIGQVDGFVTLMACRFDPHWAAGTGRTVQLSSAAPAQTRAR